MTTYLFTDQEIEELRGLLADEGAAFWRTGDYLVRKIDLRVPGHTHVRWNSNGRDEVIRDAAQRLDANAGTLRERYLTSRAFPDGMRHDDVSWTVHRLFSHYGNGNAADWMNQYRATDECPSKRRAAAWLSNKTGKPVSDGSMSGAQWATHLARHADPDAVVRELIGALNHDSKAALAYAMVQDSDAIREIIRCLDEKAGNHGDNAPRPHDPKPRDYGRLIESAVNSLSLAIEAAKSGRWEPTSREEALLYFVTRLLGARLAPEGNLAELLPSKLSTTLDEIEQYANAGGGR